MILLEQIESHHLRGNLMGDPSRRDLVVYVPEVSDARRLPVLVLLHGFGERATNWLAGPLIKGGSLRPPIAAVLDGVFEDPDVPPMIVAMPDGWSRFGCSQWVDSVVNGEFERYVANEVIEHLDANHPTIARPDSRGVFGISSGGLGAWQLASRHPEVFGAVAVLSGDSYFELTHRPLLYRLFSAAYPGELAGPIPGEPDTWLAYALASCYTPNPDRPPFYVDFPIDYPSGEPIGDLWDRWLAFDPIINIGERLTQLRALRGILLDVGAGDEYGFHYGHRILARRLTRAGIRHTSREHPGGHVSHLAERIALAVRWFGSTLLTRA